MKNYKLLRKVLEGTDVSTIFEVTEDNWIAPVLTYLNRLEKELSPEEKNVIAEKITFAKKIAQELFYVGINSRILGDTTGREITVNMIYGTNPTDPLVTLPILSIRIKKGLHIVLDRLKQAGVGGQLIRNVDTLKQYIGMLYHQLISPPEGA
jgi:hypothetical protein